MMIMMLICSIMPAFLLVLYVTYRDRKNPEPVGMIIKGVFFGMLSVFLTLGVLHPILAPIPELLGIYGLYDVPFIRCIMIAFYNAAVPEEIAKLFMLWLLLRKCKDFDENMDGIVYAVCVGMGFAGLENIGYVFQDEDSWGTVAITRALFAVPGHYIDAVIMGLFYSLVHFQPRRYAKYKPLVLFAPIMAHGIYDSICFIGQEHIILGLLIYIPLIWFCIKMHKFCLKRIKSIELLDQDRKDLSTFREAMRDENEVG